MSKKNTATFSHDRDLADTAKEMLYLVSRLEFEMPDSEAPLAKLFFGKMSERLSTAEYEAFMNAWSSFHYEGSTEPLEVVCRNIKGRASSTLAVQF